MKALTIDELRALLDGHRQGQRDTAGPKLVERGVIKKYVGSAPGTHGAPQDKSPFETVEFDERGVRVTRYFDPPDEED